jgi:hypothetical protein
MWRSVLLRLRFGWGGGDDDDRRWWSVQVAYPLLKSLLLWTNYLERCGCYGQMRDCGYGGRFGNCSRCQYENS